MVRLSRPAKTFTPKQGQYLAFIHLYTRLHRRPPAKPICSNTSALAHPRFTKWCSHSNAGDSSEDSQERPAASNCSSIPNCCPNYFECRFNQSKPLCRGTSWFLAETRRRGLRTGCCSLHHQVCNTRAWHKP